tara:strand:+ start:738 stop:911 length:174 start_codon:yes stop_codon:yes gene_type:complete
MPKINLNEYEALDQLEEHGARIKTRYKKKRAPKIKFDGKDSRISKSKKFKQRNSKYD